MSSDVRILSKEPGRVEIEAGNWFCVYTVRNDRLARTESSRYRFHASARPDELIEQADRLARKLLLGRMERTHGHPRVVATRRRASG